MTAPQLPQRIGLIGDLHGDPALALRAVRRCVAAGAEQVFQLGDFGFPASNADADVAFRHFFERELAAYEDMKLLVTLGNHEQFDQVDALTADGDGVRWWCDQVGFLPRGWRATSPGGRVFASLGGANSIDKPTRLQRGWPWSPREQITEEDLFALGDTSVDVLLGHDAPNSAALLKQLQFSEDRWWPEGLAYAKKGQDMFHRAVRQVQPALTVSGHYHLALDAVETFIGFDGPFTTRVIILNADGNYPTTAVLDTDTLEFTLLPL